MTTETRPRRSPLAWLLVMTTHAYRRTLGPFLGGHCRFHPSCSEYMLQAVAKHGGLKGGLMGVWRLLRCGPWSPGGTDEP